MQCPEQANSSCVVDPKGHPLNCRQLVPWIPCSGIPPPSTAEEGRYGISRAIGSLSLMTTSMGPNRYRVRSDQPAGRSLCHCRGSMSCLRDLWLGGPGVLVAAGSLEVWIEPRWRSGRHRIPIPPALVSILLICCLRRLIHDYRRLSSSDSLALGSLLFCVQPGSDCLIVVNCGAGGGRAGRLVSAAAVSRSLPSIGLLLDVLQSSTTFSRFQSIRVHYSLWLYF